MVLRGLLVIASGFLFIFSPGLPMRLLARGGRPIDRNLLYWGIGLWLAALLPGLFVQSLLVQIFGSQSAEAGAPQDYLLTLAGTFITALFVQLALLLFLRRRREAAEDLRFSGLTLGFGVGLIAQVFNGLFLIGAGFQLMFGNTSTPALAAAAGAGFVDLCLSLLALVLFRPTLLVVSAAQGVLVGRAVGERGPYFWLAVLVGTAFSWLLLALSILLGSANPGQVSLGSSDRLVSVVTILYYALAFGLAYRWLAPKVEQRSRVRRKVNPRST
jgi:hypothetical protein